MTTVLAVRHADIDLPPSTADPALNAAGRARAADLARLVGAAGIGTILTSSFLRTRQTVEPLADLLGVTPTVAPEPRVLAKAIRAGDLGAVVLVAGHSNTVPEMIGALGAGPVPVIGEREFDNLFLVAVPGSGGAELVRLRYGASG